jgi:hypothetical protein
LSFFIILGNTGNQLPKSTHFVFISSSLDAAEDWFLKETARPLVDFQERFHLFFQRIIAAAGILDVFQALRMRLALQGRDEYIPLIHGSGLHRG